MREQRWPWLLTAALMLGSAFAAGWSTYLYWLPCRGTMLEGTIIQPFSGDGGTYEEYERLDPAVKVSMDVCLRRMDGDISEQAPWTSELLVLAMALVGLAWLTLVFCLRWQLRTKAIAALPGLVTLVMALAIAVTNAEPGEPHALLVAVEWSALLALAVILAWQPEERTRRRFLRIAIALWGTTAFGMYHQMLAYMIMVGFSERDWDEPPGTGYLTVATITISAVLTAIMTLRTRRKVADNEQQQDDDSGSLTLPNDAHRPASASRGSAGPALTAPHPSRTRQHAAQTQQR